MFKTRIRVKKEEPETQTKPSLRKPDTLLHTATAIQDSSKLVICVRETRVNPFVSELKKVFVYLMPTDCEVREENQEITSYIFDNFPLGKLRDLMSPTLNKLNPNQQEEQPGGVLASIFSYSQRREIYATCEKEAEHIIKSLGFNN